MKFNYSSNNSGGRWWLNDKNWFDLEKAGWEIDWYKNQKLGPPYRDRFLGGLASNASKDFETLKDAVEEFEQITGMDFSDEGCSCCGAPHSMSWTDKNGQYNHVDAYNFKSSGRVNPWD